MTAPTRPGLRGRASGANQSFVGFVVKLVFTVVALGFLLRYLGFVGSKPNAPPAANVPQAAQEAPQPANAVELATTDSIQKQQLALAKVNQRQLVATFEEAKQIIDEWEKELHAWEQEGPPLLTSDSGKKVATDKAQVAQYRAIARVSRPGVSQLQAARQSAEELIKPIRSALDNPADGSNPDASLASTLRQIHEEATKARDGYRQARAAVRGMVAKTKDQSPGAVTLEDAIAALDQEDAAERLAAIDAAEKKAKDEGAKKVAEEKAKLAKETADTEAARIRDETAKKKQEAELANARSIEEMARLQKETDQQLAKLRDAAELRRQGDLRAGTFWKGVVTSYGAPIQSTMKITSRTKDEIRGSISTAAGAGLLNFVGTVDGTKLKLRRTTGETDRINWVYQPSTKTITGTLTSEGGQEMGTYSFRLSEED